jgi:hypothetical protein
MQRDGHGDGAALLEAALDHDMTPSVAHLVETVAF